MPMLLVRVSLAMLLLAVAGCAQMPPDYSPHYSYVPGAAPAQPGGPRYVLVPDACRELDPTDTAPGSHLPPGCANAYNLRRMAERERDLVEGRALGPAPAAPSARAAQRYIYGPGGQLGGAVSESGSSGAPTSTSEPVSAQPTPAAPAPPPSPSVQAHF